MRRIVIAGLGVLILTLATPRLGLAQNWIQIQGTIQAIDCQTNALVLNARDGVHVFPVTPNATVRLNSTPLGSVCALQPYVGSPASVFVAAGNPAVAAAVDVFLAAAPAVPPPVPAPVPGYGYSGYGYYGPYFPYYAEPYCYQPYAWTPYSGWPYCYGPYSGYVPYYGPTFGIGIGIGFGFGPRFLHDRDGDRRFGFVGPPRFQTGDRRFVGTPGVHGGDRRFIGGPGRHGPGRPRR